MTETDTPVCTNCDHEMNLAFGGYLCDQCGSTSGPVKPKPGKSIALTWVSRLAESGMVHLGFVSKDTGHVGSRCGWYPAKPQRRKGGGR